MKRLMTLLRLRAHLGAGYATPSVGIKRGLTMRVVPVGPRIVRPASISPDEDPRLHYGEQWM